MANRIVDVEKLPDKPHDIYEYIFVDERQYFDLRNLKPILDFKNCSLHDPGLWCGDTYIECRVRYI